MKFREIWKLRVGKFLYLWLIAMIFYTIILQIIDDLFTKILLLFIGYTIAPIPAWVAIHHIVKKRSKKIRIRGEYKYYRFRYGRIFEYVFFIFLFCATFFGTFFSVYMQESSQFNQLLITGLAIMCFTVNAIFAGYFHYVCGFHE